MSPVFGLLTIGGGPAALSAVRAYRDAGGPGAVGIVTDEHRMPYRRPPLTKDLLRGEMGEEELPLEDERWFAAHEVHLVSGRAVALDLQARRVALSGGRELEYRRCVLAPGAEPKRIPVPGADDPGVMVLRSLDHLRELQHRLTPGARPIVIGSGFIGCEIAASLQRRGHPVALVSDEPSPNVGRLGEDASAEILRWLREEGVELALGEEVEAIQRSDDGLHVVTAGARTAGTIVIMAVGVAPRLELAVAAGVRIDEGGVAADAQMRTSEPDLLAAGDVCAAENATARRRLRVEHWGDALGQGEVAGRTAAGLPGRWADVPGFWSTIATHTLKYAAWGDGYDVSRFERGPDGAFAAWYGRNDRVVGVLAHDRDDAYEQGQALIAAGAAWA